MPTGPKTSSIDAAIEIVGATPPADQHSTEQGSPPWAAQLMEPAIAQLSLAVGAASALDGTVPSTGALWTLDHVIWPNHFAFRCQLCFNGERVGLGHPLALGVDLASWTAPDYPGGGARGQFAIAVVRPGDAVPTMPTAWATTASGGPVPGAPEAIILQAVDGLPDLLAALASQRRSAWQAAIALGTEHLLPLLRLPATGRRLDEDEIDDAILTVLMPEVARYAEAGATDIPEPMDPLPCPDDLVRSWVQALHRRSAADRLAGRPPRTLIPRRTGCDILSALRQRCARELPRAAHHDGHDASGITDDVEADRRRYLAAVEVGSLSRTATVDELVAARIGPTAARAAAVIALDRHRRRGPIASIDALAEDGFEIAA